MSKLGKISPIDEKNFSSEVTFMTWSPCMDLIAISNSLQEVSVYRLSCQKVWSLSPPVEDAKVGALVWRPDGKFLAIAYTSGCINLCDVENSDIAHSLNIDGAVSHMTWAYHGAKDEGKHNLVSESECSLYLPKLVPVEGSFLSSKKSHQQETIEDSKKLKCMKTLNFLIVGTENGFINVFAYGILLTCRIQIGHGEPDKTYRVISTVLSHDLKCLSVVVNEASGEHVEVYHAVYETRILCEKPQELDKISQIYGVICSVISYMQQTVSMMTKAWEDVLIEMDKKLLKFAQDKKNFGEGSVFNDFLELLLFGTASVQLEAFLLHDLTEKGLTKLGQSIETSYSNILKLIVNHLNVVTQALMYHLSELRGLSRWKLVYEDLGLDSQLLNDAIHGCGSFALKTAELQHVIISSNSNFRAFFQWLYVAILRLSNQTPSDDVNEMSRRHLSYVAGFLQENFSQYCEDKDSEETQTSTSNIVKLEKVGQYLKDEDLSQQLETSWTKVVEGSTFIKDSCLLYKNFPKKSLLQMQQLLISAIDSSFKKPSEVISRGLVCHSRTKLLVQRPLESSQSPVRVSQICVKDMIYSTFLDTSTPCDKLFVMKHSTSLNKCDSLKGIVGLMINFLPFEDGNNGCSSSGKLIQDVSFYDEQTLSLLVELSPSSVAIVQLPLGLIESLEFTPIGSNTSESQLTDIVPIDISSNLLSENCFILENLPGQSFAVNGTRKVICVLFSSRFRIRNFIVDGDEEEEEDGDEDEYDEDGSGITNQCLQVTPDNFEDENKENAMCSVSF